MKSEWVDSGAKAAVEEFAAAGLSRDLALRVYTTRLLGRDPSLVLHGGGNTSVKLRMENLLGEEIDVLCVKGSGWDMGAIEPAGLPAVALDSLRKLRQRESLSDTDMQKALRAALLDPSSPSPSVESLLHAFVPHKFVDHTHATAVLALIDRADSHALCEEVYGKRMGFVRYVMPGFGLAKEAAAVFDANPQAEGLILDKHGLVTFGNDARQSYERMIEMVTLAEDWLRKNRSRVFAQATLPQTIADADTIAPILRGAVALPDEHNEGAYRRAVLDFRSNAAILNFVNGAELARYAQSGVVTPDHTLFMKSRPLILPAPDASRLADFKRDTGGAVDTFMAQYRAYFAENNARHNGTRTMTDPQPRVALVPGLGLFGLGETKRGACIAADIAQAAIDVITATEATGTFQSINGADMFDCEYWPLERAKLGQDRALPLKGQIAVVTGAGGAIGAATAKAFAAAGAEVALLDLDEKAAQEKAKSIGGTPLALACNVTDDASVARAFAAIVSHFGGLDILVSNAGAAWQGRIGEVSDEILRKSFELNFFAHQRVAQAATRILLAQGTGGCLLFNVSKQAVNPGPNFGPYGLPKAATLFLVRQYALDYGADGIRANAVNADRIRSGLLTSDFIKDRSKARGVSEKEYMSGNLLQREVTADDVAQAFLHQALALRTTADVTTVDGGNIAAALR